MAIGIINSAQSVSWSFGQPSDINIDCTGATLLVAFGACHSRTGTGTDITGMTYNGSAMTLIDQVADTFDGGIPGVAIFYILNPASGSHAVSVTQSGSNPNGCIGAIAFSGTVTSSPIGATNKASDTTSLTENSISVTTTAANSYLAVIGASSGNVTATVSSPTTETFNQHAGGSGFPYQNGAGYGGYEPTTSTGSYTSKWTYTANGGRAIIGVEILPAAGAATTTHIPSFNLLGVGS